MRTRRLAARAVTAPMCMSPTAAAAPPAPTIDSRSGDGTQVAFTQVVDPTAPNPAYAVWTARSDVDLRAPRTHPPAAGRSESEDETRPNGEVHVMRADGSRPQRLTHTRGPETFVSWSASGTRLVFAAAPASVVFAPFPMVLARSDGGCPRSIAPGQAVPAGVDLDAVALRCDPPAPVRPRLLPSPRHVRRHACTRGNAVEASVERGLLAGLGVDTAIRSLTIGWPPAGTHVPARTRWLRLRVTGSGARNDAGAVRPAWEATPSTMARARSYACSRSATACSARSSSTRVRTSSCARPAVRCSG